MISLGYMSFSYTMKLAIALNAIMGVICLVVAYFSDSNLLIIPGLINFLVVFILFKVR